MRLKKLNTVIFDELTHSYICGDKLLTGVTTLLHKHGLAPDLSFVDEEKLKAAADRGTAIHNLIEAYEDKKTVVDDECGNLKAYKTLGLNIHCNEYLVSDDDTIATMIDLVGEDCSIYDIKSWSKSSVTKANIQYVSWQCSIGAYLFEKMNPSKKVPGIYLARVRDGEAELKQLDRIPNEEIEALVLAEKEGRRFVKSIASADAVISEEEAVVLVRNLEMIAQLEATVKELKAANAEMFDRLYGYMEENKKGELACSLGVFVKKDGYERSSVDATKLKKDLPEIYEKYRKTTYVNGSVSFKAN